MAKYNKTSKVAINALKTLFNNVEKHDVIKVDDNTIIMKDYDTLEEYAIAKRGLKTSKLSTSKILKTLTKSVRCVPFTMTINVDVDHTAVVTINTLQVLEDKDKKVIPNMVDTVVNNFEGTYLRLPESTFISEEYIYIFSGRDSLNDPFFIEVDPSNLSESLLDEITIILD